MPVILIRHGRVEKTSGLPLSSAGSSFASGLGRALSGSNIGAIVSTADPHCLATVGPISEALGVPITTYSSEREVKDIVSQGDWGSKDVLILFRWGNASEVFDALGLYGNSPASSDEAYGNIWFVNLEDRSVRTMSTGF